MKRFRVLVATVALFGLCPRPTGAEDAASARGPQTRGEFSYERPHAFTWLKYQPGDQKDFFRLTFRRENTAGFAAMILGTGALIYLDQYLFERSWKIGNQLSITHSGQQKPFLKTTLPVNNYVVRLSGPYDLGTGLYFLGDGITHISIAGSFLATGLIASDNRALQTSSQLAEAIIATGFVVQVLKHSTGRQNPNTTTEPGGRWQWFPNQRSYAKHVNQYDAFPTGHLATAMVTVTVIAENYPEYKFVRPLGYTLMTALGFQMVNNGVHWVSDYPLGIFMGYQFARIAVGKGRTARGEKTAGAIEISPSLVGGGAGLKASYAFGRKNK